MLSAARPSPHRALAAVLLFTAAACGGWRGRTYHGRGKGEATYQVGLPGTGWQRKGGLDDVQVGWVNGELAAAIRVHSECEGHGDSQLYEFLDHLRIGWTKWQIHEEQYERLIGRESLRAVVTGELDGVAWKNEFILVKKNGCLFDLSYSALPGSFDAGRDDFRRVVAGFRFPVNEG